MDINTNSSELRSRVSQCEKGDERSLYITLERVERIGRVIARLGYL